MTAMQTLAADLQAAGAIRSEHWERWQSLRVEIDRAADDLAAGNQAAAPEPTPVDVALHAVAESVAGVSAQVAALHAAMVAAHGPAPAPAQEEG